MNGDLYLIFIFSPTSQKSDWLIMHTPAIWSIHCSEFSNFGKLFVTPRNNVKCKDVSQSKKIMDFK